MKKINNRKDNCKAENRHRPLSETIGAILQGVFAAGFCGAVYTEDDDGFSD